MLLLALEVALAAYVLLSRRTQSGTRPQGIAGSKIVSADGSLIRAPTLRSERQGLAGRCGHLPRVTVAYVPVEHGRARGESASAHPAGWRTVSSGVAIDDRHPTAQCALLPRSLLGALLGVDCEALELHPFLGRRGPSARGQRHLPASRPGWVGRH